MTNAQAAEKYGLAPILNDGYVATLHHSQQRSVGPLFEASTRYHNISNAKSLLSVLGAGVRYGDEIEIICEGEDEQEALETVIAVIEDGFGA